MTAPTSPSIDTLGPVMPLNRTIGVLNATAGSIQSSSGSLAHHSFFENRPAVVCVLLLSGMAIGLMISLTLIYCHRKRGQKLKQRQKRKGLREMILPSTNSYRMREHIDRRDRSSFYGFVSPSNKTSATQRMLGFSSLRLHTEGSVPATNGIIDAPLSLPQEQSWSSRSSYTVAIPHASLDLDVRKLRRAGWHYASPPPSREPRLARSSRTHTLSSVPPPRPKRSPLRSFATKVEHKTLRDKLKRHTRASSASNYPPTMHTSNTGARDKLTRHTRASSVSNYPPTLHTSNTEARDKLTHYTWASSVSNYPPTLHTLNTEADSLSLKEGSDAASRNTFGVSPHGFLFGRDPNADATEQREKGRGMATPATGRSSADSNESWSVSLAQYSPLCSSARSARSASLATDTSTERTSIPDDEKAYRTPPLVWTRREASV